MNDLINNDELKQKILNLLLTGESPENTAKRLECDIFATQAVFESDIFATLSAELIEKRLKSAALRSVTNLSHIANDETIGANPRIRANEILLSKALEIKDLQGQEQSAANMTQDQLIRRLNDLQNEASKRAKPIDTGVIEHDANDLDDMFS